MTIYVVYQENDYGFYIAGAYRKQSVAEAEARARQFDDYDSAWQWEGVTLW